MTTTSGWDGLRTSRAAAENNRGGGRNESGRAISTQMKEITLPSMSEELQNHLLQPPHEEYRRALSEEIIFLEEDSKYLDPYATDAGRRQNGPQYPEIILPALHFLEHRTKVKQRTNSGKSWDKLVRIVCSAGPQRKEKCLGCALKQKGADIAVSDRWAWEILHAQWYHLVPYQKQGEIVKDSKTGQPILLRNECLTLKTENQIQLRADGARADRDKRYRTCQACENGLDLVFGNRRVLSVGSSHLDNIVKIREELQTTCSVCKTRMAVLSYHCPTCGQMVLDMGNHTLSPDELLAFMRQASPCQHCGIPGVPVPRTVCGYAPDWTWVGGCQGRPVPLNLSDAVLRLQREGEGTASHIVHRGWGLREAAVIPQLPGWFTQQFKGRVLDVPGTRIEDIIGGDLCNPGWELDKMYEPLGVADQEQILQAKYPV